MQQPCENNPFSLSVRDLGIVTNLKPAYPSLSYSKDRLRSFEDYLYSLRRLIPALVQSGFFYHHRSDYVICHFCGVLLIHWLPQDDPMQEHVLASPGCFYANLMAPLRDDNNGNTTDNPIHPKVNRIFPVEVNKDTTVPSNLSEEDLSKLNTTEKSFGDVGTCNVCLSNLVQIVFLPCGHVSCSQCVINLKKFFCPTCRSSILATKHFYL